MKLFFRTLLVSALLSVMFGAPVVSAATVDRSMHFRIINRKSHVELVWKRYAKPSAFRMYRIVRSEPGGPTGADEGDMVATTTNRYSTNATDWPSHNGVYYYRLCVDKKDGSTVCSKAIKIVITNAVAKIVSESSPVVAPAFAPESPVIRVVDAALGEMALALSPTASGTRLTWTPTTLRDTRSSYVLVRSFTSATPSYPVDGYLGKVRLDAVREFVDTVYVDPAMTFARRWYRVCVVDAQETVHCGTPVQTTP